MPEFGSTSMKRLVTCDEKLQALFLAVVASFDCTVLEGYRDKATQDKYFAEGKSRLKYPAGEHNKYPSRAIDVAPYINGKPSFDMRHCLHFAGFVLGVANTLDISIRWGGDWDMDKEAMTDQDFQDLVHFELH